MNLSYKESKSIFFFFFLGGGGGGGVGGVIMKENYRSATEV